MIALASAEIGAIAQRRVALMVDPTLSFDLPPFLTPNPGLELRPDDRRSDDGRLMSENKHLAHPDRDRQHPDLRQPGRPRQHGRPWRAPAAPDEREPARILGVEAMCAAQGIEFRAPLATSAPLARVLAPPAAGRGDARR